MIQQALRHDIRDVGEIEENGQRKPFFVMPLLPGATLANLIESGTQRLTVERVVDIIVQACRAYTRRNERRLAMTGSGYHNIVHAKTTESCDRRDTQFKKRDTAGSYFTSSLPRQSGL